MNNEKNISYLPILPFDITYGEHVRLYKNMCYVRDAALCNKGTVQIESGNVTKFYRYLTTEPRKIGGE